MNTTNSHTEILYNLGFALGILPTVLTILWARFFINRWIPGAQDKPNPQPVMPENVA